MDTATYILGACSGAHIMPHPITPEAPATPGLSTRAWFPAQHVGFQGHFPGNPLLPGFLHIELVLDILHSSFSRVELLAVRSAKFLRPILPDEIIDVNVSFDSDGSIAAKLYVSGAVVSELVLEVSTVASDAAQKS